MTKFISALALASALGAATASAEVVPLGTHGPPRVGFPGNANAPLHAQADVIAAVRGSLPTGVAIGPTALLPWRSVRAQFFGSGGLRRLDVADDRQIYVVQYNAPLGIAGRSVHFANATGYQFVDAATGTYLGESLRGKIDRRGLVKGRP